MANVSVGVSDYSFHVVGIKNSLKLLEEALLVAETGPSVEAQREVLTEIHMIQKHAELLELITLRKIGAATDKG